VNKILFHAVSLRKNAACFTEKLNILPWQLGLAFFIIIFVRMKQEISWPTIE